MTKERSRITWWLALAVVLVAGLLAYLLWRPRPRPPGEQEPPTRVVKRTPPPASGDDDVAPPPPPTRPREAGVVPRPVFRDGKWFFPRALRNEGADRPNEGPLPGEDLPPPAIPDKPPVTPMIDPMDVTPEFRAEKTKLMLDHLKDRERRLSEEIARLERDGETSPKEIQRKKHFLERLKVRQRKLTEELANPPAPREPAARRPAGAAHDHDHDHDDNAPAPAPAP